MRHEPHLRPSSGDLRSVLCSTAEGPRLRGAHHLPRSRPPHVSAQPHAIRVLCSTASDLIRAAHIICHHACAQPHAIAVLCSTASDLIRAAHIICHEVGHHWFAGLVQTLNATHRGFVEESTTSFSEASCVASALPALENRAIYTQMFTPPFGDTRGLHIGALFHALDEFTGPEGIDEVVDSGPKGVYTKGAAALHMIEGYLDSVTEPVRLLVLFAFCCCALHETTEQPGIDGALGR